MKYIYIVILVLLVLLSLAAGIAKVTQAPQEVVFFEQTGLDLGLLIAFGVIQVLGGLLAIVPKSRKLGLAIISVMFWLSGIQIFIAGNMLFGFISLIPATLALALLRRPSAPTN